MGIRTAFSFRFAFAVFQLTFTLSTFYLIGYHIRNFSKSVSKNMSENQLET